MKIFGYIARWVFVLCLPVLFFTASLAWGFNSLWLYKYGFQKYAVSESTGLPDSELDKAARGLISYFNSSEEYVHINVTTGSGSFELFNEDEQVHFKDVKGLVRLDYWALAGTFLFSLGFILVSLFWQRGKYRNLLARHILWGSVLSILLLVVLGIAALFDFDQLFLQLHFVIFTNQTWSALGYMLLLFPGGFWYDATFFCIGFMVILAIIFGGSSLLYLRLNRYRQAQVAPQERG